MGPEVSLHLLAVAPLLSTAVRLGFDLISALGWGRVRPGGFAGSPFFSTQAMQNKTRSGDFDYGLLCF